MRRAGPWAAQAGLAQTETTETAPTVEVTADTVLATVGDIEITVGHLIAAAGDLDAEESNLPNDVLLKGLTERLIQQAAISQSATELTRATLLRLDNERRALIAGELIGARAQAIDISDEDLKAAYDARFASFAPSMEYNAAHILVETEDEAKALVAELEAGADFAALAMEHSTGPSGPGGGDLGWFAKGMMVEPFQAAVETLETGQVSDPVETQFGWHVIKLNDTRIPEVPAMEDMAGELQQEVFQRRLREAMNAMIEAADIERFDPGPIDPAIVRDGSLIGR